MVQPGNKDKKELMRGYLQPINHQFITASEGQLGNVNVEHEGSLKEDSKEGSSGDLS